MNFVADLRGRRLALIIDLFIAVLSSFCKILFYILVTLVGTYAQTSGLLVFASILAGFSGYSVIVVSYILAGDVC
jgi:MFS family permease